MRGKINKETDGRGGGDRGCIGSTSLCDTLGAVSAARALGGGAAVCSIKAQHSHQAGTCTDTSHAADNCNIEQLMFAQRSVIVQLGVFN